MWREHAHPGDLTIQLHQGLFAWDGAFYRDIASRGYDALPEAALRFFPLYPLFGRGLGWMLGGNEGLALLLIANVSALAAGALMHRLVLVDLADRRTAQLERVAARARRLPRSCSCGPTRRRCTWSARSACCSRCGVGRGGGPLSAGLLAGLTRPFGVVLAVPAAIEAPEGMAARVAAGSCRSARRRSWHPIVGLGAFLLWIGSLEPIHQQGQLRGEWIDPFRGLGRAIGDMFGSQRFLDGLHAPFAIALVILVVLCIRWLPPSYTAYTAIAVLSALSATNLNSLERLRAQRVPGRDRDGDARAPLAHRVADARRVEQPDGGDVLRRLARPLRPLARASGLVVRGTHMTPARNLGDARRPFGPVSARQELRPARGRGIPRSGWKSRTG